MLDIRIDKLTNSIENSISGEIFETAVRRVETGEGRALKKADWQFNWQAEVKNPECEVYKLITVSNPEIVHGLISLTDKGDHIFMNLIENAKFNKGKKKLYKGVAGNLVAFACKLSFEKKYEGVVSFISKYKLINHYRQTLGARVFSSGNRMYINTPESRLLAKQYFKNFQNGQL
jgi:hypothetical protein